MKKMQKILIGILIALLVLIVLAALAVRLFLDSAIKKGIETVGPMLTKVEVKLDSVNVKLLTGSGKIKGLVVGNPEGFKTPYAISVGSATLALQPGSLLSDKVISKSINLQAPEITLETDLRNVNLKQILANLDAASGSEKKESRKPAEPGEAKPAKKLQVDDFLITGGKVNVSLSVLGGRSATVVLPEIHFTDLGKGPDGITPAELTAKVLRAVLDASIKAGSGAATDLGKGTGDLTKDLGKSGAGEASKAAESLGGLFKKKKE
jgi:uncharacterized protein involved in outer membrane biogenesis